MTCDQQAGDFSKTKTELLSTSQKLEENLRRDLSTPLERCRQVLASVNPRPPTIQEAALWHLGALLVGRKDGQGLQSAVSSVILVISRVGFSRSEGDMEKLIERHNERIVGVLSGFDRVVFRGTIRALSYVARMDMYLNVHGVLYKHLGDFAQRISNRIREYAAAHIHVRSAARGKLAQNG